MMRILAVTAFVAGLGLSFVPIVGTTATAQTATCGPVAYSNADQTYAGVPCTPAVPKAEAGQAAPCGPVAYSNADQKYVGVPCSAPTPKAEAGKAAPCGPVAYSNTDQKYVGVPCTVAGGGVAVPLKTRNSPMDTKSSLPPGRPQMRMASPTIGVNVNVYA